MRLTPDQIREHIALAKMPEERALAVEQILAGKENLRFGTPIELTRATSGQTAPNGQSFDVKIKASTETIARDSGIIPMAAWERGGLANFAKNPVILAFHNNREPIGISVHTEIEDNNLVQYWKFHEETQTSREMKALYMGGWLRAASVGFLVTEFQFIDELPKSEYENLVTKYGASAMRNVIWIAKAAELLETSAVPVPSDPNALMFSAGMRSALANGITVDALRLIGEREMPVPAVVEPVVETPTPEVEAPAAPEGVSELRALVDALVLRVADLEARSVVAPEVVVPVVEVPAGERSIEIEKLPGESDEDAQTRFVDDLVRRRVGAPVPTT